MQLHLLSRVLLAVMLAANGIAMLAMPQTWYGLIPGVPDTGPLNAHFVRDIGCAYLISGVSFLWLVRQPRAWPAAMAGTGFLILHALVHVGEMLAGTIDWHHLLEDIPGVFLVPALAFWLALPRQATLIKENDHVEMDSTAQARRL